MKRSYTLLLMGLLVSTTLMGQPQAQYTTAAGIRLGGTSGFSIKHMYRPSMAFEGIAGGFANGFSLTGLIEKIQPAFNEKGLNWYYGGGAHVAVYNGRNPYYNHLWRDVDYRGKNEMAIGINGIVGIEYRLPDKVPIVFCADLKPFLEFSTGGSAGMAADPSIGVKYIIR